MVDIVVDEVIVKMGVVIGINKGRVREVEIGGVDERRLAEASVTIMVETRVGLVWMAKVVEGSLDLRLATNVVMEA